MEEQWKVVPAHPYYRVSNFGRVESRLSGEWRPRNLKRINKGKGHTKFYLGFNAVLEDRLPSGDFRKVTLKVHILVAELFIGPRPEGMLVCHIDDDETNNRADNLKYGTHRENVQNMLRLGKFTMVRGEGGLFKGSKKT